MFDAVQIEQIVHQPHHLAQLALHRGHGQRARPGVAVAALQHFEHVAERREGIPQLVRQRGQELVLLAIGGRQVVGELPLPRHVARNLRGAHDAPLVVHDGRDGERDPQETATVVPALRLEVIHAAPGLETRDDLVLFGDAIVGNDQRDMAADGLLGGVPEQALGAGVPALNDAVERLPDDRVVRRFDDGGELARRQETAGVVALPAPPLGDVAEDEHAAGHGALVGADRRGAVVDGALGAVSGDEHRVIRQPDGGALPQRAQRRIRHRLARVLVDDAKDGLERLPDRLGRLPPRQGRRRRVQRRHAAPGVGGDDGVADAGQRDPHQFPAFIAARLSRAHRLADGDDERAGEQVGRESNEILGVAEKHRTAGGDKQIVAGEVAGDRHQNGRAVSTNPHRGRNRTEERDERQCVAQDRVEQETQANRSRQGRDRHRVSGGGAVHARQHSPPRPTVT